MLDNAVARGVKHAIYFFYPRVPEGTLVGGAHPNAIAVWGVMKEACIAQPASSGCCTP